MGFNGFLAWLDFEKLLKKQHFSKKSKKNIFNARLDRTHKNFELHRWRIFTAIAWQILTLSRRIALKQHFIVNHNFMADKYSEIKKNTELHKVSQWCTSNEKNPIKIKC